MSASEPLLPARRAGLRRSTILLAGFAALVTIVVLLRGTGDDGWRLASTTAGLRARGVVYLSDMRAFVVHTDEGPLGLSAVSPHLGEPIAYCRSSRTFMELRHGSQWDRLGYYLAGPSPRGMDHVETRVRGDVVQIDPGIVTGGPARGAGPPAEPSGPFCDFESPDDATRGFLAAP